MGIKVRSLDTPTTPTPTTAPHDAAPRPTPAPTRLDDGDSVARQRSGASPARAAMASTPLAAAFAPGAFGASVASGAKTHASAAPPIDAGATPVFVVANKDYRPATTVVATQPKNEQLGAWLREAPLHFPNTYENTDKQAVRREITAYLQSYAQHYEGFGGFWNRIIDSLVALFTGAHVDTLAAYGIKSQADLAHLSPRQAMALAEQIVMDAATYNDAAIAEDKTGRLTPEAAALADTMDELGADQVLEGSAIVCRNYAEAVIAVFDVLKGMQEPGTSQLNNSYIKYIRSFNEGATHAWTAMFTVQPDGSIMTTQGDATWNDAGLRYATNGDDYTEGKKGVRRYYLDHAVYLHSGSHPLARWLEGLVGLDFVPMNSIGLEVLEARGGVEAVCKTLDALPPSLRADAFVRLAPAAQIAVQALRPIALFMPPKV